MALHSYNAYNYYDNQGGKKKDEGYWGSYVWPLMKSLGIMGLGTAALGGGYYLWDQYGRDLWNKHMPDWAKTKENSGIMDAAGKLTTPLAEASSKGADAAQSGIQSLGEKANQAADSLTNFGQKVITPMSNLAQGAANYIGGQDGILRKVQHGIYSLGQSVAPVFSSVAALARALRTPYDPSQGLPQPPQNTTPNQTAAQAQAEAAGTGAPALQSLPPQQTPNTPPDPNTVQTNASGGYVPRFPWGGMGYPYGMAGGFLGQPMSRNQFHLGMSLFGNPNSQNILKNTNQGAPWQSTLQNYLTYNVAPKLSTFYGDQYANTAKYLMQGMGNYVGGYGAWSSPTTTPVGASGHSPGFVSNWAANALPSWQNLNTNSLGNYNTPVNPTGGAMPNVPMGGNNSTGFYPGRGYAYGGEVPRYEDGGTLVPKYPQGGKKASGMFGNLMDTFMAPIVEGVDAVNEEGAGVAPMAPVANAGRRNTDATNFGIANSPYARNTISGNYGNYGSLTSPNNPYNNYGYVSGQGYYPPNGQQPINNQPAIQQQGQAGQQGGGQIQGAPMAPVRPSRFNTSVLANSTAVNPMQALAQDAYATANVAGAAVEETSDLLRQVDPLIKNTIDPFVSNTVSPLMDKAAKVTDDVRAITNNINSGHSMHKSILGLVNDVEKKMFGDAESQTDGWIPTLSKQINGDENTPGLIGDTVKNITGTKQDDGHYTGGKLQDIGTAAGSTINDTLYGQDGKSGVMGTMSDKLNADGGLVDTTVNNLRNRIDNSGIKQSVGEMAGTATDSIFNSLKNNVLSFPEKNSSKVGKLANYLGQGIRLGLGAMPIIGSYTVPFTGGIPKRMEHWAETRTPWGNDLSYGYGSESSSDSGSQSVIQKHPETYANPLGVSQQQIGGAPMAQQQQPNQQNPATAYGGDVPRYAMGSRGYLTNAVESMMPMALGGAGLGALGGYIRTKDEDYLQKMLPYGIGGATAMGLLGGIHGLRSLN